MRWHRVQFLIDQLVGLGLDKQGWFQARLGGDKGIETELTQKSVVRTNCMDCLDRTNVVQSQLARWVLQKQLETAGVVSDGQKVGTWHQVWVYFPHMWADNADAVSTAYSGTGALKTDFTRLGERTKQGALNDLQNSIKRYYLNNFLSMAADKTGLIYSSATTTPARLLRAPFWMPVCLSTRWCPLSSLVHLQWCWHQSFSAAATCHGLF